MRTNHQQGFTLIETFIAISILLLAITGPLTLVSNSISDASYAANQITAFYLAQEGLELVINRWEENKYNNQDLLLGLENCASDVNSNGCQIFLDENLNIQAEPCGPTCAPLNLNKNFNSNFGFNYDPSQEATKFIRTVKIDPASSQSITDPEVDSGSVDIDSLVTVNVTWNDKGQKRSFNLSTLLNYWWWKSLPPTILALSCYMPS